MLFNRFACLCLLISAFSSIDGTAQDRNSGDYNFNSDQQIKQVSPTKASDTSQVKASPTITSDSTGIISEQPQYAAKGDLDSLKLEILSLRKDLNTVRTDIGYIQRNLYLSHTKFKTGTILFTAGLAGYLIGSISIANTPKSQQISPGIVLITLGGFGSMVTGAIMMINSHKYIGKAGTTPRRYNVNRYKQY